MNKIIAVVWLGLLVLAMLGYQLYFVITKFSTHYPILIGYAVLSISFWAIYQLNKK